MPEIITGQDGSYSDSADAAESAKVELARAELYDETAGEPGELILGKYQSVDDLARAYQSLQSEYSRLKGGQEPVNQEPSQEAPEEAPVPQEEPEGGEPQPQQPDIDPERAQQIRDNVLRQAGGEQQFQRLGAWASNNLPPERINVFNTALQQGDEGTILSLLKGLQYDFMMANGYEPRLSGGRAPSNEIKGFSSEAQVVEAMNDPRYSGANPDPAYIKEVERRLAVSNVFQSR